MDWLGAWAIHRSRLHADRLAEDRRSKRLDLRAELLQKTDGIANEAINQAIGRSQKIDEAQLNEDEKEQLQQELRALQPRPEEEDSGPVDEETRARAVLYFLDESARKILRGLARLESGVAQLINPGTTKPELIDLDSSNTIYEFPPGNTFILDVLVDHNLITRHDLNLYKITDFGRKVASISENK